MADVLTVTDLVAAKGQDTFHSEVITGKAGGVAGGADIDYATNSVTGQVQATLPKVLRDVGFKPASFNFVTGGTLGISDADKCIYNPAPAGDNNWYSWGGTLPHDVVPDLDPTAVGSGYVPRTDVVLRNELTSGGSTIEDIANQKTVLLSSSGAGTVGLSQGGTVQDAIDWVVPDFDLTGATDVTAEANAFFAAAASSKKYCRVHGVIKISAELIIDGSAGSIYDWDLTVVTDSALPLMVRVTNQSGLQHTGSFTVFGAGSTAYTSRTCVDGVRFENCRASKLADKTRAERFLRWGFDVSSAGNNTLLNLGDCRTHYCGSATATDMTISKAFTSRSDTGVASSAAQRSVIGGLTGGVPANLQANDLCGIDGEPYVITAFDATTITVFPWTRTTASTGIVDFYIGGGVRISGDDAAQVNLSSLDATHCGQSLRPASLYGVHCERLLTQFCGAGLMLGEGVSSAQYGNSIENFYSEGNSFDVVSVSAGGSRTEINTVHELNSSKLFHLGYRAATREYDGISSTERYIGITSGGKRFQSSEVQLGLGGYSSSYSLTADNGVSFIKGGNTVSVTLTFNAAFDRMFGHNSKIVNVYGRRAGSRVDSITITDSAGHTVMGVASYVISGVTTVLQLHCWYDVENSNWVITKFVPA